MIEILMICLAGAYVGYLMSCAAEELHYHVTPATIYSDPRNVATNTKAVVELVTVSPQQPALPVSAKDGTVAFEKMQPTIYDVKMSNGTVVQLPFKPAMKLPLMMN